MEISDKYVNLNDVNIDDIIKTNSMMGIITLITSSYIGIIVCMLICMCIYDYSINAVNNYIVDYNEFHGIDDNIDNLINEDILMINRFY